MFLRSLIGLFVRHRTASNLLMTVMLVAGVSRDLVEKGFDAVEWVRSPAGVVGGGGGGRADMAQAGGKFPEKLSDALDKARVAVEQMLREMA